MSVSTPFTRAATQLGRSIKLAAGVRGTYSRGLYSIDIIGTPGRLDPSGDIVEDVPAIDVDSCWLFTVADMLTPSMSAVSSRFDELVLDRFDNLVVGRTASTSTFIPVEGDYWTFIRDDGGEEIYRVLPPYQAQHCWSWMDPMGVLIRVFTKRVETIYV